ncbi:MAG: TraR/DksA family transcriptional regulator [Spirochaetia bacterium]|nr:TraR/DksA family transcriptional regulator [Spirochaetia bacterium]
MKKNPFTEKELKDFKSTLLEKKTRVLKEIQEHSDEAHHEADEPGDLVDMASELLEKELNLTLTEKEKEILNDIDEALERIAKKTFGICVDTGEVISKVRLKAIPEAKRTLEAQEAFDKIQREKRKRLLDSYK